MGNFKYCPNCGHKLDEAQKFCPECGKALTDEGKSGFSFSKIGKGLSGLLGKVKESEVYNKATDAASGALNKAKGAIKEKTEATRVTAKVIGKIYQESQERVITKLSATYGDGLMTKSIKIEFTNKALKIYETDGVIGKKLKKTATDELLYNIPLNDITEVYRQENIGGNVIYYVVTTEKTHPIFLSSETYRFFLKLSSVLKFEGGLYNVELAPDETMVCVANGQFKKSPCTIYLTDKRILVAAFGKKEKMFGGAAVKTEGKELVLDLQLNEVNIREELGALNANYIISSSADNYTIAFNKEVPQEFLSIVPDAVGNKELLERQKKLKKGLKVASIAVGVLAGGAIDMDADDLDVDDMDMELDDGDLDADEIEVDLDGDGDVDSIGYDLDGDGDVDAFSVDCDNDGTMDSIAIDSDGDGTVDTVSYDTNGDGAIDEVESTGAEETESVETDTVAEEAPQTYSPAELQAQEMKLNNQIMSTADPIKRAELIRQRDAISQMVPNPIDEIISNLT